MKLVNVSEEKARNILNNFKSYANDAELICLDGSSDISELQEAGDSLIHCRPGTKATLVQNVQKNKTRNAQVYLDKGSELSFVSVQALGKDVEGNSNLFFHVGPGASLKLFEFNAGGAKINANTTLELQEDAKAESISSFMCSEGQNFEININAIHKGKNSRSFLNTRGVSGKDANAKCKGLIKVEKDAAQSDGYQDNNGLVLDGHIQFLPFLEIENPDVKCSHNAKVTHIDESKLFYLQSRGLKKESAIKAIVEGFLFRNLPIEDKLRQMFSEELGG